MAGDEDHQPEPQESLHRIHLIDTYFRGDGLTYSADAYTNQLPKLGHLTHRRDFVSAVATILGGALYVPEVRGLAHSVATVHATPTVFHAHPDARTSLIRFEAHDVDAIAGRLRVYNGRRRLLGTAGMIRVGEGLYGELWLPLERETRVVTELESPGVRGILRTSHSLRPQRRWTIYWLTVAHPDHITRRLEQLPPVNQTVERATYAASGVMSNPLLEHWELADHVSFLRMGERAHSLETRYGIPPSTAAVGDARSFLPATLAVALAGSGVRYLVRPWNNEEAIAWLEGAGGARVLLIALPPGANSTSLGFNASRDEMTRRIEQWLETLPSPFIPADRRTGGSADGTVLVVDTSLNDDYGSMRAAVAEWNTRFAYPRIVEGAPDTIFTSTDSSGMAEVPTAPPIPVMDLSIPSATALAAIATQREADRTTRAHQIVHAFAPTLDALANRIDTATPGTLIFNPSPFPRTDVVTLLDGSVELMTDLPGIGYALAVNRGDRWDGRDRGDSSHTLETDHYRLTLDRNSGAIRSLVNRRDGIEFVQPGSDGLNAVTGTTLEGHTHERLAGIGERIVARRWSPSRGDVRTTVTMYESLPWVDVENDARALGDRAMEYRFHFAVSNPEVTWEVPAGHENARAPVNRVAHLRWVHLRSQGGTVLFRGIDAPHISAYHDGTLISYGPRGRSRYRLRGSALDPGFGETARFGWGAEPVLTAEVPEGGPGSLPRFGSLFVIDQPGIAAIDVRPADNGDGLIVYLQEQLGASRLASLGAGLLRFGSARLVDHLERDLESEATAVPDGVVVHLPAWGIVVLRLVEVELRGG